MIGRIGFSLGVVVALTAATWAGEAPLSCRTDEAGNNPSGCELGSDLFVWAQNDPDYEIVGRITDCAFCTAPASDGSFDIVADVQVAFGPYQTCNPADGVMQLTLGMNKIERSPDLGGPDGDEVVYIPTFPSQSFFGVPPAPLNPNCVDGNNIRVTIPAVELTGAQGATAQNDGTRKPRWLAPPNVRVQESGVKANGIDMPLGFRFTQDLRLQAIRTEGPGSALTLWPEAMAMRLGPHVLDWTERRLVLRLDGASGPVPYKYAPPEWGGLNANQVDDCSVSLCSTTPIHNLGYLAGDWSLTPGTGVTIDNLGMDFTLVMPPGSNVLYETLFPRDQRTELFGPAELSFDDSRLTGGWFSDGQTWLQADGLEAECDARSEIKFQLNDGGLRPQVGPDGTLLAGITDLTGEDGGGNPADIRWTFNEVTTLGCGTLYTPSAISAQVPVAHWYTSAVPTVIGRGIYPGVNYNRNRVCVDGGEQPTGSFCVDDSDCGSGETCEDGGFSPLCDPTPGLPEWRTDIQTTPLTFLIDPQDPGQSDRELAFYARKSGITGVFDAGDDGFLFGDGVTDFKMDFTRFGHAFLGSKASQGDTIIEGGLISAWPSDTTIPFEDLQLCNCGYYDSAHTPDVLLEKKLAYWEVPFEPYGLQFSSGNKNTACDTAASTSCDQKAESVCVTANIPMPRFEPEFTGKFGLHKTGDAGKIDPYSVSRFDFDRATLANDQGLDPYTFDVEAFLLSDWPNAGSPTKNQVTLFPFSQPFGFYDAEGDFFFPFFGLTDASVQGQFNGEEQYFRANMHRQGLGNLGDAVPATRSLAGGAINLDFLVDYVQPSDTTDPNDSNTDFPNFPDVPGLGRGTLFAFADQGSVELGPLSVATGMVLKPQKNGPGQIIGGDVGAAAVTRLWGSVNDPAVLSTILPSGHLGYGSMYSAALSALGAQNAGHTLPTAPALQAALHDTGAIAALQNHPDLSGTYDTGDPITNAANVTGFVEFSPDLKTVDAFKVNANLSTGGEFFALDGSDLDYDRHVNVKGSPIAQLDRKPMGDASDEMELQDGQKVPFPQGGSKSTKGGTGGSPFPGFDWYFDYELNPPQFVSLTGHLDLTKGGLSSLGFDEMNATMKFWGNGDWYFDANLGLSWDGYKVNGGLLFGNTTDLSPLVAKDPDVAGFLEVDRFKGGYVGMGLSAPIFNYGCFFKVGFGVEVGGWYLAPPEESFGGKVRGYVYGKGACLVSIRGDLTLIGGKVNDKFKLKGNFWLGGGIGFCDEEDWNSPADVLDDDWCISCAFQCGVTGTYPPDDLNLQMDGPNVDCSL